MHKFEYEVIAFDDVKMILEDIFDLPVSRQFCGWYYQQFLKMQYSRVCENEYYLAWDGDTFPIRKIELFDEDDRPYLDWKREYHEEYFTTISKIFPGVGKVIEPSFIAEHMLFSKEIMQNMINEIESAGHLVGKSFYERILRVITPEALNGNSFSEFETYGTYVALKYTYTYKLRRWTSFRNCGQYFYPDKLSESDIQWLSKDFHALSFEKNHHVEDDSDFFRDPEYQKKFSARYILELIQENMTEGYVETWD